MQFTREDTKAVKGIAIVLMLYHHLFFFPDRIDPAISYLSPISFGGHILPFWIGEFGKICVALFLFLGGYGTFLSSQKRTKTIVFQKIGRLYVEYWKIFLVFIPLCLWVGVERVTPTLGAFLLNFSGLSITYCGEWWFFTPYVALLLFFPLWKNVLRKTRSLWVDLTLTVLLAVLVRELLPHLWQIPQIAPLQDDPFFTVVTQTLALAPTFCMGCIVAKHDLLSKARRRFFPNLPTAVAASVLLLMIVYLRHREGSTYDYLFAPLFTLCVTLLLHCRGFGWLRWCLEKIGRESTVIWLVHSIYCYLLCQKLVFLPYYTFLIFLWLLVLSFATALLYRGATHLFHKIRTRLSTCKNLVNFFFERM